MLVAVDDRVAVTVVVRVWVVVAVGGGNVDVAVALLVRVGDPVAAASVVAVGVGVGDAFPAAPGVPTHSPPWQRSLPVHVLPSLQDVLSGAFCVNMQSPVALSH